TGAPRARRERPTHSARRRSTPRHVRSRRTHLVLDPRRVLLVCLRIGRELDDALLPMEWVAAPHVDVRPLHLDNVVTRPPVDSKTRGRDGPGVDDEEVLQLP